MRDSKKITGALLRWYRRQGRSLPWRGTRDPYAIWVSEIMLQQTRVDTVIPYYLRFLSRFPTVKVLAEAPLEEVLKAWENMGYYSRARNLHEAARIVAAKMEGRIPESYGELLSLPGIGAYTASAILSFALGRSALALDANVLRVLCRLFVVDTYVDAAETASKVREMAAILIPEQDSGSFNQALMDLGSLICTPRNPGCSACPLREHCIAFRRGVQESLPMKKRRPPIPHKEIIAAVIRDAKGRFAVVQRPAAGLLGGLWKFPGGEKAPSESLIEAVHRTVQEEIGIRVEADKKLGVVKHSFTHFHMRLHVFDCRKSGGRPHAPGGAWRWADARTLRSLPLAKADRKILDTLVGIKQ